MQPRLNPVPAPCSTSQGLHPDIPAAYPASPSSLRGSPDETLQQTLDVGRLPATTGLSIYAHACGARLRETLENDHPALGAHLGDEL